MPAGPVAHREHLEVEVDVRHVVHRPLGQREPDQLPGVRVLVADGALVLGALNFAVFWSLLFVAAYRLPGGVAATLGAGGLFAQTGLFSQYVIGAIELLAASLLLIGILPHYRHLQAGGALAALLVMTGAISFHLFTPLGIDPNNDGAGLFVAACLNWAFAIGLLAVFRRRELLVLVERVVAIFAPSEKA